MLLLKAKSVWLWAWPTTIKGRNIVPDNKRQSCHCVHLNCITCGLLFTVRRRRRRSISGGGRSGLVNITHSILISFIQRHVMGIIFRIVTRRYRFTGKASTCTLTRYLSKKKQKQKNDKLRLRDCSERTRMMITRSVVVSRYIYAVLIAGTPTMFCVFVKRM